MPLVNDPHRPPRRTMVFFDDLRLLMQHHPGPIHLETNQSERAQTVLHEIGKAGNKTKAIVTIGSSEKGAGLIVRLPSPTPTDYMMLVKQSLESLSRRGKNTYQLPPKDEESLLELLDGMSLSEAKDILKELAISSKQLNPAFIERAEEKKRSFFARAPEGFWPHSDTQLADLAGYKRLKSWLAKHQPQIEESLTPTAILVIGPKGCGKTVFAQVWSHEHWNRFPFFSQKSPTDFKAVEEGLRTHSVAPMLVLIDEIETVFATSAQDDYLPAYKTFLKKTERGILIFATSDDVEKIPPDFLKNGFTQLFFVDLPSQNLRESIFEIHLRRRDLNPGQFDLKALANKTENFSGAEIERAVVFGLYKALAEDRTLDTPALLDEISRIQPRGHSVI